MTTYRILTLQLLVVVLLGSWACSSGPQEQTIDDLGFEDAIPDGGGDIGTADESGEEDVADLIVQPDKMDEDNSVTDGAVNPDLSNDLVDVFEEIEMDQSEEVDVPCDPSCTACGELNGCEELCDDDAFCDDGIACTVDSCDGELGCKFEVDDLECDDGVECTLDYCDTIKGACEHLSDISSCKDDNPCTDDFCDPSTGCKTENNTQSCDDGNECTVTDVCVDGACVGSGQLGCDDGNFCTDDSCDLQTGCVYVDNAEPCDDNSECTINDVVTEGSCVGTGDLVCDDQNSCTKDFCLDDGGCDYEVIEGSCQDGNACTTKDICIAGSCVGGGPPDCDDANSCTADSCDELLGCQHEKISAECDDGNACTDNDMCSEGICTGGEAVVCDDSNTCTQDACIPAEGCVSTAIDIACNDLDACTVEDWCVDGDCVGVAMPCEPWEECIDGACQGPSVDCPPVGPFGTTVGDYLPNVTLMDCDGNTHEINDLCGFNASWFFVFGGW